MTWSILHSSVGIITKGTRGDTHPTTFQGRVNGHSGHQGHSSLATSWPPGTTDTLRGPGAADRFVASILHSIHDDCRSVSPASVQQSGRRVTRDPRHTIKMGIVAGQQAEVVMVHQGEDECVVRQQAVLPAQR